MHGGNSQTHQHKHNRPPEHGVGVLRSAASKAGTKGIPTQHSCCHCDAAVCMTHTCNKQGHTPHLASNWWPCRVGQTHELVSCPVNDLGGSCNTGSLQGDRCFSLQRLPCGFQRASFARVDKPHRPAKSSEGDTRLSSSSSKHSVAYIAWYPPYTLHPLLPAQTPEIDPAWGDPLTK